MCTVTYLPGENNSFILTSNRDERPERLIDPPEIYEENNEKLIYPKDHKAGGTWIAVNRLGRAACLLNGAFEKHTRKLGYRKSRGLVLLDLFGFSSYEEFYEEYDFDDIEPFTLITVESGFLVEIKWNGEKIFLKELNSMQPYIWSSVTLYSNDVIELRENWFTKFINANHLIDQEDISNFHHFAGNGDEENNLIMNRGNDLHTLSITSIVGRENNSYMIYDDLLNGRKCTTAFTSVMNERMAIRKYL